MRKLALVEADTTSIRRAHSRPTHIQGSEILARGHLANYLLYTHFNVIACILNFMPLQGLSGQGRRRRLSQSKSAEVSGDGGVAVRCDAFDMYTKPRPRTAVRPTSATRPAHRTHTDDAAAPAVHSGWSSQSTLRAPSHNKAADRRHEGTSAVSGSKTNGHKGILVHEGLLSTTRQVSLRYMLLSAIT